MGRRRGDIFSKRDYNYGSRLFSNLVTGLIASPFAIMSALPSSSSYDGHEPISRKAAVILLIIGVALAPLFIPWFAFGFEWLDLEVDSFATLCADLPRKYKKTCPD